MLNECIYCGISFSNYSISKKANHSRWCIKNPNYENYRNENGSISKMKESREKSGFLNVYKKAEILGLEKPKITHKAPNRKRKPMREEIKKKISDKTKKRLAENPSNHPWKRSEKFVSKPCEKFKNLLRENNINFLEEYSPLFPEHFYSADVCFPDKKIIIEINGNQHYDKNKNLKPYYQKRHNLLTAAGWVVYEYHYSIVYKEQMIKNIINELKTKYSL